MMRDALKQVAQIYNPEQKNFFAKNGTKLIKRK